MRFRTLFPGALLIAASALAQTATPATPPAAAPAQAAAPTTTLNVTTRLVIVPVTLRDSKEHLIRNLTKDDFTLTVDGKPQPIRYFDREDDVPLTVGLLVDVSGSMRNYLDAERTASTAFLDGMLQPGRDAAFVVQFGHNADLLADVTGSVPKLQAGIKNIDADDTSRPSFTNGSGNNGSGNNGGGNDPQDNSGNNNGSGNRRGGRNASAGGGTVLYDAVFLSSDEVLKKAPAAKLVTAPGTPALAQSRKAVVLLTDGDDRGSTESLTASIEAAQRNDVAIYAIYYKPEEQHDNNNGGRRGGGFPGGFPGGGGRGGGGGYPGGGGGGGGRGGGGGGGNTPGRSSVDGKKILERMADETGGRVFEVTKKLTLPDIYKEIAEELRSQYRLGFTPVNNEDGYHKVVVDIPKQKKLILQARDGYYTGAQSK